jgi:hypothetical protein
MPPPSRGFGAGATAIGRKRRPFGSWLVGSLARWAMQTNVTGGFLPSSWPDRSWPCSTRRSSTSRCPASGEARTRAPVRGDRAVRGGPGGVALSLPGQPVHRSGGPSHRLPAAARPSRAGTARHGPARQCPAGGRAPTRPHPAGRAEWRAGPGGAGCYSALPRPPRGFSGGSVVPSLVHSAQTATAVNLCFIVAALLCAFGLPRRLADQDDAEPDRDTGEGQPQAESEDVVR